MPQGLDPSLLTPKGKRKRKRKLLLRSLDAFPALTDFSPAESDISSFGTLFPDLYGAVAEAKQARFSQNLGDALKYFHPKTIKRDPWGVLHAVNSIPQTHIPRYAQALNKGYQWMDKANIANGVDGMLTSARNFATFIPNHYTKAALNDIFDTIQAMPKDEQAIVWKIIENPDPYARDLTFDPNKASAAAEKFTQDNLDNPDYLDANGQLIMVPGTNPDTPGLSVPLVYQTGLDNYVQSFAVDGLTREQVVAAMDDFAKRLGISVQTAQSAAGLLQPRPDDPNQIQVGGTSEYQKRALAILFGMGEAGTFDIYNQNDPSRKKSFLQNLKFLYVDAPLNLASNALNEPMKAAFALGAAPMKAGMEQLAKLGDATKYIAGTQLDPLGTLSAFTQYEQAKAKQQVEALPSYDSMSAKERKFAIDKAYEASFMGDAAAGMEAPFRLLGDTAADITGLKRGSIAWQERSDLVTGVTMLVASHYVGKYAKLKNATTETPLDVARADVGLEPATGELPVMAQGAILGRVTVEGVPLRNLEPLRRMTQQLQKIVLDSKGLTNEEWFYTDAMGQVFDEIAYIRDNAPSLEVAVVQVRARYHGVPGMPVEFIDHLVHFDREAMAAAAADWESSPGRIQTQVSQLKARRRVLDVQDAGEIADFKRLEPDFVPTAAAPAVAARLSPVVPGTVYHGTRGELADISQASPLAYGDPAAKVGPGVYLTDDPAIAEGYSKTKGSGQGRVLTGQLAPDLNLLDADAALPENVLAAINDAIANHPVLQGSVDTPPLASGATWLEAIRHIKESLHEAEVTQSDALEVFVDLEYKLEQEHGLDGVTHLGGKEGKVRHEVTVLWETGSERTISSKVRAAPEPAAVESAAANIDFVPPEEDMSWMHGDPLDPAGWGARQLERMDTNNKLEELNSRPNRPILRQPRPRILRNISRGNVMTTFERKVQIAFTPIRLLNKDIMSKLFDEQASRPKFFDPTPDSVTSAYPRDYMEISMDNLRVRLERELPEEWVDHHMARFFELSKPGHTSQDLLEWWTDPETGVAQDIIRHAPPNADPEALALLTAFTSSAEEGHDFRLETQSYTKTDGSTGTREIVVPSSYELREDGTIRPVPSTPEDFATAHSMADFNAVLDVYSGYRRFKRLHPVVSLPARGMEGALRISTVLLKPWALAPRMAAVVERLWLEQVWGRIAHVYGLRKFVFSPGGVPFPYATFSKMVENAKWFQERGIEFPKVDPRVAGATAPKDMSLGSLGPDMEGGDTWAKTMTTIDTTKTRNGTLPITKEQLSGWSMNVQKWSNSPVARIFIGHDFHLDSTVEYILGVDRNTGFARDIFDMKLPRARRSWGLPDISDEAALRKWLGEELDPTIRYMLSDNPDLYSLVTTGRMIGNLKSDPLLKFPSSVPDAIVDQYHWEKIVADTIHEELADLSRRRSTLTAAEQARLKVMYRRYRAARLRTREILDKFPELPRERGRKLFPARTRVTLSDTRGLQAWLKKAHDDGRVRIPERLAVPRAAESTSTWREILDVYTRATHWSYRLIHTADMRGARGTAYWGLRERYLKVLKARGWSAEDAAAEAEIQAAEGTNRLLLDLSERTSAMRANRNTLWFGSAWQETLGAYGYTIPKSFGNIGVGALSVTGEVLGFLNVLRGLGVVQKDPDGVDVVVIPGLDVVLEGIVNNTLGKVFPNLQIDIPPVIFGRVSSFNMVTNNPMANVNPVMGQAIVDLGRLGIPGMKALSDLLIKAGAIFSYDSIGTPSSIIDMYEFFTRQPFPEFLSPKFAKSMYDRSYSEAVQYAWADLQNRNIKQPYPENFKTQGEFEAANRAYWNTLFQESDRMFQGIAFLHFVGGTVFPARLDATTEEKWAWEKFWQDALDSDNPDTANIIDNYMSQHPDSVAYGTFLTYFTDKAGSAYDHPMYNPATGEIPRDTLSHNTDEDYYYSVWNGQKQYTTKVEQMQMVMAGESDWHYSSIQNETLRKVSPDLDWVDFIGEKGRAYKDTLLETKTNHDDWLLANPNVKATLDRMYLNMRDEFGVPIASFEVQKTVLTMSYLNELTPSLGTEGGVRDRDWSAVLGDLAESVSDEAYFGKSHTPLGKHMADWTTQIYIPYVKQVAAIYDRARVLDASGLDPSATYEEIRTLNNKLYDTPQRFEGREIPSPEESAFGLRSVSGRDNWLIKTASLNPLYLDNFQLDKTKVAGFSGRNELQTKLNDIEQARYDYFDEHGYTGEDSVNTYYDGLAQQAAGKYGQEGKDFYRYTQQLPAERAGVTMGWTDQPWTDALDQAKMIQTILKADGYSIRGTSKEALFYKDWFGRQLVAAGALDPNSTLGAHLEDIGAAIPAENGLPRGGYMLLETAFFGTTDFSRHPDSLMNLGA